VTRRPCASISNEPKAALCVHFERAVAGVGGAAVRHLNLEEAFAAHGDIEIFLRRQQRALTHDARGGDGLDARTDLDADRQDRALFRGLRADAADLLVEHVLKFGALALVTGGAHVGDVVGDDLDIDFLGHHAGRGGVESAHAVMLLKSCSGQTGTSASFSIAIF
jgi:hypothetical protein